jgi:outer membrane protein TolC
MHRHLDTQRLHSPWLTAELPRMIDKAKRSSTILAGLVSAIALGGCTMGPDSQRPDWTSPASWFAGPREVVKPPRSVAVAEPLDATWWTLFGDLVLTRLEQRVAAQNLDVQAAGIRFTESRAQLGFAQAAEFPTLNGNGSYTRQKASNHGVFVVIPSSAGANGASGHIIGGVQSAGVKAFDIWQGGFDASWEVDFWGRVRRSVESATASLESADEAKRSVLMTSLAEVAHDYIHLHGVQTRLQIGRDNVRYARQSLNLTQQRAAGGVHRAMEKRFDYTTVEKVRDS